MSRAFYLLVTAVLLKNYLFYEQGSGLNYFAFALFLLALVLWRKSGLFRERNMQLTTAGFLLTGFTAVYYGHSHTLILYVVSVFLLIGYSSVTQLSPYVSAFNGILSSLGLASFQASSQWLTSSSNRSTHRQLFRQFRMLLLPFLVTLVFYGLYYWANPDFSLFDRSYVLDTDYIFLTMVGFIWLPSLVFPYSAKVFAEADLKLANTLSRIRGRYKGQVLGLKWEYRQGIVMLGMLNLLLLVFLVFEGLMFSKGQQQQTAYDFSQSVHDSVNVLIFSILLAITLMLFYFRKNLNFFPKNRTLIRLAYTWIFLNLLLLGVTTYTNMLYIENNGLTFKRIGVYFWLFQTGCGLFTTLYKIHYKKSIAFLFRINSWVCYFTLIVFTAVPWTSIITTYNLSRAQILDLEYLKEFLPYNLPQLQESVYVYSESLDLKADLLESAQTFQKQYKQNPHTWQSWNYADWKINQYIETHPLSK
ncbi:hypothetical protein BWI97_15520 [Siphonobacter sp. BAB-5405]|uniref:DUF4153 domain-containing protein n=1 Tax=Siphonobacter sp. BAB-5405 TaxID=1864825 RepID=UPI000C809AFB|nr:DUF4173 domain-containing protein [Siphonobacter sp. BAB-5405]PMD95051.1 hypothetical protein BWI97_15520 [Siphonobacter sp. BAB-5405]